MYFGLQTLWTWHQGWDSIHPCSSWRPCRAGQQILNSNWGYSRTRESLSWFVFSQVKPCCFVLAVRSKQKRRPSLCALSSWEFWRRIAVTFMWLCHIVELKVRNEISLFPSQKVMNSSTALWKLYYCSHFLPSTLCNSRCSHFPFGTGRAGWNSWPVNTTPRAGEQGHSSVLFTWNRSGAKFLLNCDNEKNCLV